MCWGEDAHAVKVPGLSDFVQVVAGTRHDSEFSCALHKSGTVSCRGSNPWGTLGDGTQKDRLSPVSVKNLEDARQLSAGPCHACAVRKTARFCCWGYGGHGQRGPRTRPCPELNRRPGRPCCCDWCPC